MFRVLLPCGPLPQSLRFASISFIPCLEPGGLDPWTSFLATPTYVKVSGEPLCGHLGRDPFVETGFGFESETGFSIGMYVKQTVSIQPVSMDS